jgi:hypothetical protein
VNALVVVRTSRLARLVVASSLVGSLITGSSSPAVASGANTVAQWNKIAEDVVVGSGALQIEGLVYMSYTQLAVFDALVAIHGGYAPYGHALSAPAGASGDAAAVEAAYTVLATHFPASAATLAIARDNSLGAIANGQEKVDGIAVGHEAALGIIALRNGDGRKTPIGTTSSFPTKDAGPGVWRLTPPAYLAPQIPWAGSMTPFVLPSGDRFLPPPPAALSSDQWVAEFNEIKTMGSATSTERSAAQTATGRFYTANVIRQWNGLARDIAASRSLGLMETARLAAMINVVGADAGISVLNAKYHYLFWRPVTAIDPSSVKPDGDGFGPVPGFDDGTTATVEQAGWRPLITTPNHPEYPAAHGTITSAIAEVLTVYLGTSHIDVDVHGFDAAGAPGNLDAVHHFGSAQDLRKEVINARLWGGVHYRFSSEAGVDLGRSVAKYDLRRVFSPLR